MSDEIVLDCKIGNVTTNWPKNDLRITLVAKLKDAEYEAPRLGELARSELPVNVKIHEADKGIETALALFVRVESVRADHKSETLSVTISVHTSLENAGQAELLGTLAYRDLAATARFEPRQMSLNWFPKGTTGVEMRTFSGVDAGDPKGDQTVVSSVNTETGEIHEEDPLLPQAIEESQMSADITASSLQRKFRIGYPRASSLIDAMVGRNIIIHPIDPETGLYDPLKHTYRNVAYKPEDLKKPEGVQIEGDGEEVDQDE